MKTLKSLILILTLLISTNISAQEIIFGIFADCQYCDCDSKNERQYRSSIKKLETCIASFNKSDNIAFNIGLGDLIDKNVKSFHELSPILKQSKAPIHHVIGNHDYSIDPILIPDVPNILEMPNNYYHFQQKGWYFIFMDGYELTTKTSNKKLKKEAEKMLATMKAANNPNAHSWNGGVSSKQLQWLAKTLKKAKKENCKALVFCHYPLRPFSDHCLWNTDAVLSILEQSDCVKAWFNGHHHKGNYAMENGIHYINIKGMVDTDENAFSIVSLFNDKLELQGFGRETDRTLKFEQ